MTDIFTLDRIQTPLNVILTERFRNVSIQESRRLLNTFFKNSINTLNSSRESLNAFFRSAYKFDNHEFDFYVKDPLRRGYIYRNSNLDLLDKETIDLLGSQTEEILKNDNRWVDLFEDADLLEDDIVHQPYPQEILINGDEHEHKNEDDEDDDYDDDYDDYDYDAVYGDDYDDADEGEDEGEGYERSNPPQESPFANREWFPNRYESKFYIVNNAGDRIANPDLTVEEVWYMNLEGRYMLRPDVEDDMLEMTDVLGNYVFPAELRHPNL